VTLQWPRRVGRRTAIGWIAAAAAVGLTLRLAFSAGYWIGKPLTHDELEYMALARSIATGQGFTYPPVPAGEPEPERFGRAPGYPFVLSGIAGEALRDPSPGSVPLSIKVWQSFIGALAVIVLAAIAWHVAGPAAGVVAAAIAAVHPPLVWISAYALSEVVYVPMAWFAVWLLDRSLPGHRRHESTWLAVGAGVAGGFAALVRPGMLIFLGLAVVWVAVRRSIRVAIAVALAATAVILPWTARNVGEYGRFVLIASEGGVTFWTGNHPFAIGDGDLAANPEISRASNALRAANPGLSPEELESVYYREAIGHITDRPVWWIGLLARKLFYLVVPIGPSYRLHSTLYEAGSIVPYLILLPLAALGGLRIWRTQAHATGVWLMLSSAVVTALVFFPQERFRIPTIDPALIVLAAAWIARGRGGSGGRGKGEGGREGQEGQEGIVA